MFLCGARSARSSDWASRAQFCQLAAHGHLHPGTAGPDLDARWACALPAGRSCACLSSVSVTEAKAGPLAVCLFVCWQTPAWLEQMIAHTTWRDLFYKLAEAHPDCLMLNFTVKVGGALELEERQKCL